MIEDHRRAPHSLSCRMLDGALIKSMLYLDFNALGFFLSLNIISDIQIKRKIFNIWCSFHLESTLNPAVSVCFRAAAEG